MTKIIDEPGCPVCEYLMINCVCDTPHTDEHIDAIANSIYNELRLKFPDVDQEAVRDYVRQRIDQDRAPAKDVLQEILDDLDGIPLWLHKQIMECAK